MRVLTIRRNKTFVGCLVNLQIYIEDPIANELIIGTTPCRKLGTIKNGEEKTFPIGEEAARVYVIADKLSKNFCNEYFPIPAGESSIFLSGKCHYNPVNGNAFRFDGMTDPEVLKNRQKTTKKGFLILPISILVGVIVGVLASGLIFDLFSEAENNTPKTFTEEGMSITLTEAFSSYDYEGFTAGFASREVAVYVIRDGFDQYEGLSDYSLEQYGRETLNVNGLDPSVTLQTVEGLTCFEYDATPVEGENAYNYFSVIYKSGDAFWLIQFCMLAENAEEYRPQVLEWAKSVSF